MEMVIKLFSGCLVGLRGVCCDPIVGLPGARCGVTTNNTSNNNAIADERRVYASVTKSVLTEQ